MNPGADIQGKSGEMKIACFHNQSVRGALGLDRPLVPAELAMHFGSKQPTSGGVGVFQIGGKREPLRAECSPAKGALDSTACVTEKLNQGRCARWF